MSEMQPDTCSKFQHQSQFQSDSSEIPATADLFIPDSILLAPGVNLGDDAEISTIYDTNEGLKELKTVTELLNKKAKLEERNYQRMIKKEMQGKIDLLERRKEDLGNYMVVLSWRGKQVVFFTKEVSSQEYLMIVEDKYYLSPQDSVLDRMIEKVREGKKYKKRKSRVLLGVLFDYHSLHITNKGKPTISGSNKGDPFKKFNWEQPISYEEGIRLIERLIKEEEELVAKAHLATQLRLQEVTTKYEDDLDMIRTSNNLLESTGGTIFLSDDKNKRKRK